MYFFLNSKANGRVLKERKRDSSDSPTSLHLLAITSLKKLISCEIYSGITMMHKFLDCFAANLGA